MSKISGFLLSVSAVIFFSGAARAGDAVLLALNTPAKSPIEHISAELKDPATGQLKVISPGYTDFDAFSSVNDPLYREGSKELLIQVVKEDAQRKAAPREAMRDAPISKRVTAPLKATRPLKKIKAAKPLHADPVKVKDIF